GSAGLPGPARGIDPHIDPLYKFLRQAHVIVFQKDRTAAYRRLADKFRPSLHQTLAFLVFRVSLARNNELDWPLGVSEQTGQTLGVTEEQVRTFILGKAPGNAQG